MWFKAGQEADTIKEMIDWILFDHKISVAAFREKTAIMMSCKRAIKANHHLDSLQAKALLRRLPECENPIIARTAVQSWLNFPMPILKRCLNEFRIRTIRMKKLSRLSSAIGEGMIKLISKHMF